MWHQAQTTASLCSKTGDSLVLESVNVSATVNGILLDVVLEQQFVNPKKRALEITYTFPLPWQARLLDVEAVLNNQKMVGTVYEKQQAEENYEKALSEGDSAMLLEDIGNGLWSLSLGNLAAKESCTIKVHYVQLLRLEQGHLRVTIPTVIAPRYGKHDETMAVWQQPQTDMLAEYPFNIKVLVQGELAGALISSPSHDLQTQSTPNGVQIALGAKAWLDRDFVLELKDLQQHSWALSTHTPQEQTVLLGLVPQVAQTHNKRIKILVDCSGSMSGDRIDAAKRSLATFIQHLQGDDLFSLSCFGSSVKHLSTELQTANSNTKTLAQQWVSNLQANMGGTEMESALSSTFNLAKEQGGDVLLITDGDINDINKTLAHAKKCGQRVFVVGIGSSSAEPLLRQLADNTGGACEFVNDHEPVEEAINRTLLRLGQAQLQSLCLEWPSNVNVLWQSPLPMSVFNGDTVAIYARVQGLNLHSEIVLWGNSDNQKLASALSCVIDKSSHEPVERMAASAEVETLLVAHHQPQALALSLKHRLVNSLTSYCLVLARNEGDKVVDEAEQVNVKQMLAAGWGGTSSTQSRSLLSTPAFMRQQGVASIFGASGAAMMCGALASSLSPVYDAMDFMEQKVIKPKGLSALSLAVYARSHYGDNIAVWPTTFKELKNIGLEKSVVKWLQRVALAKMAMTEADLVQCFLQVFMRDDVYEYLKGAMPRPVLLGCTTEMLTLWNALQWHAIEEMQGDWPCCVYDLTWHSVVTT